MYGSGEGPTEAPDRPRQHPMMSRTVVRNGLRLVLDREPDLAVGVEAGDGHEAVALGSPKMGTLPFSTYRCRGSQDPGGA